MLSRSRKCQQIDRKPKVILLLFFFCFTFSPIKLKISECLTATRKSSSYFSPLKLLNIFFFPLKEEDPKNAMSKEWQVSSLKSKLSRLQKDIEKASQDQEGV